MGEVKTEGQGLLEFWSSLSPMGLWCVGSATVTVGEAREAS